MITNNKNRENHWLDSDKELIELFNYQLMVSGAERPHQTLSHDGAFCCMLILRRSKNLSPNCHFYLL